MPFLSIAVEGTENVKAMVTRAGVSVTLKQLMPQLDVMLSESTAEAFETEGGSYGQPWAKLSEPYATRKRAKWGDRPKLVASGNFRASLVNRGHAEHVSRLLTPVVGVWGSRVPYGNYHQTGTPKMPQRLVVKFDQGEVEELLRDAVLGVSPVRAGGVV